LVQFTGEPRFEINLLDVYLVVITFATLCFFEVWWLLTLRTRYGVGIGATSGIIAMITH